MFKAVCLIFVALSGGVVGLRAQGDLPFALKVEEQPNPPRLELQFRLAEPWPVKEVSAAAGDQHLPVQYTPLAQAEGDGTALLFLIDRSDPARAKAVEAAKGFIQRTINGLDDHTQFAVYAFDADLIPIAEFGTRKADVPARLKAVKASGMATELYRDTIEAIKVLDKVKAARKAVILFSDGKAEDTTFSLEQTVAAARQSDIAICGIGYAEKPSATIFLQSMRRLAAESFGHFAEADIHTKKEPATFMNDLLARLRSGGKATVDLSGLKTGKQIDLEVHFDGHEPLKSSYTLTTLAPAETPKTAAVESKVDEVAKKVADMAKNMEQVPSKVEEAAKKVGEENRKAEEEVRAAENAARAKKEADAAAAAAAANAAAEKKRHVIVTVLSVLLVALLVAAGFLQARRKRLAAEAAARLANAPVFARLQLLDGDGTEWLMRTTALRVGRGKDNDLALKNDSVSRHHAEIHRTREGDFTITELNAGNGVLVNGEQVSKATLKNDDIIELGEVRIRFVIA